MPPLRLATMSDLHFEYMKEDLVKQFFDNLDYHVEHYSTDVLILAGDICQLSLGYVGLAVDLYKTFMKLFRHVVMVPGNHEHFQTRMPTVDAILTDMHERFPRFHYLKPGVVAEIEGQRFLGGTLWYDGKHDKYLEGGMPDFHYIKDMHGGIYYQHNADFVEKVCKVMTKDDIIVSHHLPHPLAVAPQFQRLELNAFFLSDQTKWIVENKPKLWVFGHTHIPCDKTLTTSDTRLYCNPLGYSKEGTNTRFWERVQLHV